MDIPQGKFNSDNNNLLILRPNIVRSWQPLHTES